jgi:hypothetical protein
MITEETLLIEPKFQDAIPLRNHLRVIMASNSDWVIPADLEERRFAVLDVCDKCRMDTEYFGGIIKQMETGGREALLYDLLHRKIKSNLREIPRTQALYEQMINSMDSLEKWWLSCLHTEKITADDISWPQYLLPNDVHDSYSGHCSRERERHPITYAHFFRRLRKLCPGIRLKKMDRGSGRENYSCFPYLEECRNNFEDKIRITVDWEGDEIPF